MAEISNRRSEETMNIEEAYHNLMSGDRIESAKMIEVLDFMIAEEIKEFVNAWVLAFHTEHNRLDKVVDFRYGPDIEGSQQRALRVYDFETRSGEIVQIKTIVRDEYELARGYIGDRADIHQLHDEVVRDGENITIIENGLNIRIGEDTEDVKDHFSTAK